MPKLNPARQVVYERFLARRLRDARMRKGWTLDDVAQKLADAGCPLDRAAVHKVEGGARRVSVDELVAFSKVYREPVNALLAPIDTEVRRLLQDHLDATARQEAAHARLVAIENRLLDIVDDGDRELVQEALGSPIGDVKETLWRIRTGRSTNEFLDQVGRMKIEGDTVRWAEEEV